MLSEHLYLNVENLKDCPHFKGVEIDDQLERLIVVKKRFDKNIKEFALDRWKTFEDARKLALKAKDGMLSGKEAVDGGSPEQAAEEIENLESETTTLTQVKEEFENMINRKNKGGAGERHVIKLLQPVIDNIFLLADELDQNDIPILNRNLDQVRDGGNDIIGVDFLAIEVKNQATINLSKWFDQTKEQASKNQEPVLIYKVKGKWRVMMFGLIPCGKKSIRTNVDIDMSAFIVWFEMMLKQMLGIAVD